MISYKGLVSKYIKNEKRSVIPIFISIILTATAIMSVAFITQNILRNNLEENKIIFGDYDVRLQKINNERLDKIKTHENVKDYALSKRDSISINVEREGLNYDININSYGLEKKFFDEYINFKVIDGRLPENENEIVLNSKVLEVLPENSKVGSNIEFVLKKFGEGEDKAVNYTIVGIIETGVGDRLFAGSIIRLLTEEEKVNTTEEFEVFAYLNDITKEDELANDLGIKYILPTLTMLDPYGYEAADVKYPGYDKESFSAIMRNGASISILGIIIAFCFIAVYNTFHASVAKRIKVYGILRAVGGDMGQISWLIYSEALTLYLVAMPIGLLLGYGLTKAEGYLLVNSMGILEKFTMDLNLEVILITLLSTLIITFIAVASVLRKEGKLTPIEAIMDARGLGRNKKSLGTNLVGQSLSGSGSDEDEREAVKEILNYEKTTLKFKIMKRLFKFEGEIAHKNITRDADTYKLTKRTLFVAMAILIFFFLQVINDNVYKNSIVKSDRWDIELSLEGDNFQNSVIEEIKNLNGIEEIYRVSDERVSLVVPSDVLSEELKSTLKEDSIEETEIGSYKGIKASIMTLDEKAIKFYEGIDKNQLDNGGVLLVNKATNYKEIFSALFTTAYINSNPVLTSKVGDKLLLSEDDTVLTKDGLDSYYADNRQFNELSIVGTVDDDVLYSTFNSTNKKELDYNVKLLTTEEGLNKILGKNLDNKILIKTTNNENRIDTISELKKISVNNKYKLTDVEGDKLRLERNLMENLGLNIIFSITMIIMVILNLVNTTNAVILSRRKELAGMRAVGMSNAQERKMIVGEVFYVSLSVGVIVALTSGVYGITAQGINIGAGKVSIVTLLVGELLIILFLIIVSTLTSLAPLAQAKKFSIVDDLKEE